MIIGLFLYMPLLGECFLHWSLFPPRISESVIVLCCLFSWPVQQVCSQGMSTVVCWDSGIIWKKEGWRRIYFWSIGNGFREERETTAVFQVQS